jgi:hypothetical protein
MAADLNSPAHELTRQFYEWEVRGRGWDIYSYPVALEPPFRPFTGHFLPIPSGITDDGRKATFFSSIFDRLKPGSSGQLPLPPPLPEEMAESEPEPFSYPAPIVEIQVRMSREMKITAERAARLVSRLAARPSPVSFELISRSGAITLQFACAANERADICRQIAAYFPEAEIQEQPDFLIRQWETAPPRIALVDFALSHEFMLPVNVPGFDVDPLIAFATALSGTYEEELAVLQVIFQSVRHDWAQSMIRSVTDHAEEPFFADAPKLVERTKEKIVTPLLAAVIRVAACAGTDARAWRIARDVGSAFGQFRSVSGNEFVPLENEDYPDDEHASHLLARLTPRSGMILNASELAAIVHLPAAPFSRAPENWQPSAIPDSARARHVYISGKPGYGKSTVMYWMAMHDITRNRAVAVLDPNGDLVEQILKNIPEHRVADTIYLDGLSPIPLDFMGWQTDQEREILSDDLIIMFRRLSEGEWGPRMDGIFRYTVYSILEARRTFLDIYHILVNANARREILQTVTNPSLLEYWENQFPASNREAVAPIASRMAKFLLTPPLATALGHPNPKLKVAEAIDENKVILVNLKKMGEDAANFYGSMIVAQIQQAIWRRGDVTAPNRKPFYLYVDEFQDFKTSTFGKILSQARKFNLGLTLANQHPKQIGDLIDDIRGCVSSFITFRMDADHALALKSAIRPYEPENLEKLPVFRAFYSASDGSVSPVTIPPPPVEPAHHHADEIRKRTVDRYACNVKPLPHNYRHDPKPDDIASQTRASRQPQPHQTKGPRTPR